MIMKNVVYTGDRVDVVHAHWAFKGTAYGCSNCGEGAITPMGKYCMECGAKMDLDETDWPVVKGIAPDRVDVVRCRECKYGNLCVDAFGHRSIQCTNPNCPASMETWPLELDWYCAGGERRDDNGKDA